MTLEVLAGLTGVVPSYLSMIENGKRPLDRYSIIMALAAALRVPPAELAPGMPARLAPAPSETGRGDALAPGETPHTEQDARQNSQMSGAEEQDEILMPDPDMFERITRAVERAGYVDSAVISWLERCLAEHRNLEDEIGARPLVRVVRQQLSDVARMAREAPAPICGPLINLAAQYAQFMAWMANDLGNKAAALAWYDRAHDWATEAGDASMAATAISMKAHLAWSIGDGMRCVRLGEGARWHDGRISPGVQGMATQMIARGYALSGNTEMTHRMLDDAEQMIASAASRPEDEPPWMYFYGDTWLMAQRGMIEVELAERGKGNAQHAVTLLEKALGDLPDSYRRDRTWYGTMLARAYAAANDFDMTADTGLKFAADAMAVNRYAAGELEQLAIALSRRGVAEAHDLSDALAAKNAR
jgi:transcriptional regulator with XRE-family HTH domain